MKLIFLTRFSFFGVSVWRSRASQDPNKLLDPQRPARRFTLFENITAASLQAQSDTDFDWIVLSSAAMRRPDKQHLRGIVKSCPTLGNAKVLFAEKSHAANVFKHAIWRNYPRDQIISTVVLDDDDALHRDFVKDCKEVSQHAWDNRAADDDHVITSFPVGFSLLVKDGRVALYERDVPFTNLGLTLTAPAGSRRNLFFMSHKQVVKRRTARVVRTEHPTYLRTVHDSNDSRAQLGDAPKERALSVAKSHFPDVQFDQI
ncbi:hypothetical protein ACMU_08175 [Actibacterium mucosum KCTC 23349]|uniref:Rhamnosyl transferase n=1 Tax=Actibacterium mucosum KCTC 23349 TaxID=1454373 RepID=A0A037ZLG0_9RHOB|nr:glycosyltransferase [Actibacterium mucosum]KAJ56904.1 hypothetical protein ACMU_08175 [Actibacterium mucosum KCTC 23349]